ncbi:oligosaccharide flippase family protein [Alteromonas sp. 1_MG-2023]|uniref:oligosaccharide flippase family protein n=1 Tax=Alteromonas sp. 1_MG-2023 TaxID=3062669 RepID=UPI0026E1C586|nr:oligosaccharide flippase family protein [Alteromonas sp. 1_MG-2023]MDO6566327.1 oligosaccharide flippase family protein [Alteromonas sp. 1_MG-2023]
MSNARRGMIGSVLLVVEALAKRSIGIISTLILARVLVPEDFGIVAIATLIMGFIDSLVDAGADQYLQRCEKITDDTVNTAWSLNIIIKLPILLILAVFANYISTQFNEVRIENILYVLAASSAITLLKNPGLIYLRRELNYKNIIKLSLFSKAVSVVIAISIALNYQSYWALVIGTCSEMLITTIGSFFLYKHKIRFNFSNLKEQWLFSSWMIPQSVIGFFRTQLDTLLVSNQFGKSSLGSYHVLKYLAFLPCSQIILPATNPLLISLTKIKSNYNYLISQYNMTYVVTMIVAGYITAFLCFRSELVINILLGENWIIYSNLLTIFAFLIPSFASLNQARRLLLIHGKTKVMFYFEILSLLVFIFSLFLFETKEIYDFALVRVIVEALTVHTFLIMTSLYYNGLVSTVRLLLAVIPVVTSLLASGYILNLFNFNFLLIVNGVLDILIFTALFFVFVFIQFILGFNKMEEWKYIFSLKQKLMNFK